MKNTQPFHPQRDHAAARVMAAYRDQPTLCLTIAQVARLCQLDAVTAMSAVDELTRSGGLRQVGAQYCTCECALVA